MAAIVADRDLLFGLLALQNGLSVQAALFAAVQTWTRDESKSLADHLGRRDIMTRSAAAAAELARSGGAVSLTDRRLNRRAVES
jgi:hypothetical protein